MDLPVSKTKKKQIAEKMLSYRSIGYIDMNITKVDGKKVYVETEQTHVVSSTILSDKQLKDRVRDVFEGSELIIFVKTNPLKGGSSPNYHEIT